MNGCDLSFSQIQFLKDFEHIKSTQEDVDSTGVNLHGPLIWILLFELCFKANLIDC